MAKQIPQSNNLKFKQWLGGLIDVKGSFLLTKGDHASLEVVMSLRDERLLQEVKNEYGGSIKLRSNANALRYRLHHLSGLLKLLNDVNGHIRNSSRLVQFNKLCIEYGISIIYPYKLTYDNGWLAGFFDAHGFLNIKLNSSEVNGPTRFLGENTGEKLVDKPHLVVYLIYKDYNLVVLYKDIFGGDIKLDGNGRYIWSISSLEARDPVLNFLEYVKINTLRSDRHKRFFLVPQFFNLIDLNAHQASNNNPMLRKAWSIFNNKFNRHNVHITTKKHIISYNQINRRYIHNTSVISPKNGVEGMDLEKIQLNPLWVTGKKKIKN